VTIDIKQWKENTKYIGGSAKSKIVQYFWKIIEEMSTKEQSLVLKFVTSCPRPPLMGFKFLEPNFTISLVNEKDD
jgi:ubiquitin-protein ligase E3 C